MARRPSARASSAVVELSVRCTPNEKAKWERASYVMDVTLADVAREAWNRLHVEMAKEEEKVKRWSKR